MLDILFCVGIGEWADCSTKRFLTFEHKGTRIFLITKDCFKKKMCVPIFLNKAVGLRNENATFLHNFALPCLHIIRKWLTICVFAGLTRNLILAFSNATRCVPTRLTGWDAGSSPAWHEGQKYPLLFHGDCSTKVNVFVEQSEKGETPHISASLQSFLPLKKRTVIYNILLIY